MIEKVSNKENGYTQIGNDVFKDKNLSLEEKGYICTVLSFPGNWGVSASAVAGTCRDSPQIIRRVMNSVEKSGYLNRKEKRNKNKFGGYDVKISDFPVFAKHECVKHECVKHEPVNTEPENTKPVNTEDVNTEDENGSTFNTIDSNTIESNPYDSREGAHESKRFVPPSVEDVAAYCRERGNRVNPQRFVDYYTANGWKVGKNSMQDWQAAVRNWERNETGSGQTNAPEQSEPGINLDDFYEN